MARRSRSTRVLRGTAWAFLGLTVSAGGALGGLLTAPFPTDATARSSGLVSITDARGQVFAQITPPETRAPVASYSDISPCMVKAITAAEDERFFSHKGIDPLAIGRALIADITHTGREQGGSTITQQYVKMIYTGSEKTKLRKVREAALAVRLEQRKSKQEILRLYLNAVNFGNGLIGVEAAAKDYFGIDAKDLNCAQSAVLAGTVNAPTYNNPRYQKGANNLKRLKYVMDRMVIHGDITSQYESQVFAPGGSGLPKLQPPRDKTRPTIAPEYTDEVVSRVRQQLALGDDLFAKGPITIKTPLDLDLQTAAISALKNVLPAASDPEAAIVAIDPRNGAVRALTTKRDGGYQRGGFDLATQAHRNSGSTVKPFTLATALASGNYTLNSGLGSSTLIKVPGCAEPFKVANAEPSEGGYYSLRSALASSINTIYAPLAVNVGLTAVRDTAVKAGIPASAFEGAGGTCPVYPSQSLGMGNVTPFDLVHGYATLSDSGQRHDPAWFSSVTSVDSGQSLFDLGKPAGVQAIPATVADQTVDAMRTVITNGTGIPARPAGLSQDLWGKTGTTDDFTNAWFVGCNPTLCLGVWMGYDKSTTQMRGVEGVGEVFGGTLPAKIFNQTLTLYAANRVKHKLPPLPTGANGSASPSPYVPTVSLSAAPVSPGKKSPTKTKPSKKPTKTKTPSQAPTTAPVEPTAPVTSTEPAATSPPPVTLPVSPPASPATGGGVSP